MHCWHLPSSAKAEEVVCHVVPSGARIDSTDWHIVQLSRSRLSFGEVGVSLRDSPPSPRPGLETQLAISSFEIALALSRCRGSALRSSDRISVSSGSAIIARTRCRRQSRLRALSHPAGGGKCPSSCPDTWNGTAHQSLCKSIGEAGESAFADPQDSPAELRPVQLFFVDRYSVDFHGSLRNHATGLRTR